MIILPDSFSRSPIHCPGTRGTDGKDCAILADDHPVVRTGIRGLLEQSPDIVIVAEADNGADIIPLVKLHQPDVLILDIEMPQLSGIEVAQAIKEHNFPVRVLATSATTSR